MKKEELNLLLDKYYKGESSEEEERILKEFFQGENVPAEYEAEKEIFCQYSVSGSVPEPSADFEERIIAGLDQFEKNRKSLIMRRVVLYSLSTAAGIMIVAGSYFLFNSNREPKDTFSDPKIAYAETMKILMKVSEQLNQGNQALEPLNKMNIMRSKSLGTVNKSTRLIKNSIEGIDNLDKKNDVSEKQ
jgi:hypothetical protein